MGLQLEDGEAVQDTLRVICSGNVLTGNKVYFVDSLGISREHNIFFILLVLQQFTFAPTFPMQSLLL